MCLADKDSTKRLQIQGYWIKHNDMCVKIETEKSVVIVNGRCEQAQIRKQVETGDYSL